MALIYEWEKPLLSMATEAGTSAPHPEYQTHHTELLEWAYAYCARVTSLHSRSFFLASRLLPQEKRQAVRALYTFCRTTDDIVDHPAEDVAGRLSAWRRRALNWDPASHDLVPIAWANTCSRYRIPKQYAEQLISGVARDLHQTRYETFADLASYCYGVASTVGLMSMHIIGFHSDEAIPYAIRLGVALQLTNILRDVGEDWQRGRFYLPLQELKAFGLSEEDVHRGVVTDTWRAFMKFQIARTRQLYEEAWPGIGLLALEGRLAIAAAADFYAAILNDIEAHDYDVFSRRAYVSGWGKVRRIPALYWRTRIRPTFHKNGRVAANAPQQQEVYSPER